MDTVIPGILEPFSPRSVCEEAVKALLPVAHAKGLSLEAEIPAYLPERVQGDEQGLRRILVDLLAKVIASAVGGKVRFQVGIEEGGPGILVFHCEIEGAGPSLVLAESPIDALGGTLGCDIRPGKGSRFWFTYRMGTAPSAKALRLREDGNALQEPPPGSGGPKILVCEDNPMNQKVIRLMLEHLGHASDISCNGQEALDAMAVCTYELVFMDCQMPVMDGYEATRRIRAHPDLRDTIVIAMTAHAMVGDREKCLAAGMDDYISKPISFDGLGKLIDHWTRSIGSRAADR